MTAFSNRVVCVYLWWCGDNYCDCTKPIVQVRSEERPFTSGWTAPYQVAEGPFVSEGYGAAEPGEKEAQEKWMAEAREWYRLPPPSSQPGEGGTR